MEKLFKIYPIEKYNECYKSHLAQIEEKYPLEELINLLEGGDNNYHLYLKSTGEYLFYGDLDGFNKSFEDFELILIKFLKEAYDIVIEKNDIEYTENEGNSTSFHYVVPKLCGSIKKIKEVHMNLKILKEINDMETALDKAIIDIKVYSNRPFRYPNQSKENIQNTRHIIKRGEMKSFIIENIPKGTITINNKPFLLQNEKKELKKKETKNEKKEHTANTNDGKETEFILLLDRQKLIDIIDKCFEQKRFSNYDDWFDIGCALKNKYGNYGFEIFNYFSSKDKNKYKGTEKTKKDYESFNRNQTKNNITMGTFYDYAKKDNEEQCELIKKKYTFGLSSTDMARYIKHLQPERFIWKDKKLYCYNGKYWEQDDDLLRKYISTDLYDFLNNVLVNCFYDFNDSKNKYFYLLKKQVDRLKDMVFKKEIIETTKEYLTNNEIEFDDKFHLLGFNNKVYDLKINDFRDYRYDDYVSITTGYDWIEPPIEQVNKMNQILNQIMPISEERHLYLEIMSTCLEGRCLEKFIIFNGGGRNGKGTMDDILLKALGNGKYAIMSNCALLFEKGKTSQNQEKANLHKKRFILFREPPKDKKIENSVVKDLTGGGDFSARDMYDKDTKKKLHGTVILECNSRPLFAEDPEVADIDRFIDMLFRCSYTAKTENDIDPENHIYMPNIEYKTEEFKETHKKALLRILFDTYKQYYARKYRFNIPKAVENRSVAYLEMSCSILQWINSEYTRTENKKDIIQLKSMYNNFKNSVYFSNLSKADKRKYNYQYFINQIAGNPFFKKYYKERLLNNSNVITNYREKNKDDHDYINDNEMNIDALENGVIQEAI